MSEKENLQDADGKIETNTRETSETPTDTKNALSIMDARFF